MRILVLGGTGFLGRHLVQQCVDNGHRVSVFARGNTKVVLPSHVERFYGDRNQGVDGLKVLANGFWDVCVDLSGYTATQVQESTAFLRAKINHYVFISAVRVYRPQLDKPITEASEKYPTLEGNITEINAETYGRLKAACESIVKKAYLESFTILRPQVIVGAYDFSGRVAYWLNKAKCRDSILLPGDGLDFLQLVDAYDVAKFTLRTIECNIFGDFNLSGIKMTWKKFSELLEINSGIWISAKFISEMNLGFRELPLFRQRMSLDASYMNVSNEKAVSRGFSVSDPAITVEKISKWLGENSVDHVIPELIRNELLSREKELRIIEAYKCARKIT